MSTWPAHMLRPSRRSRGAQSAARSSSCRRQHQQQAATSPVGTQWERSAQLLGRSVTAAASRGPQHLGQVQAWQRSAAEAAVPPRLAKQHQHQAKPQATHRQEGRVQQPSPSGQAPRRRQLLQAQPGALTTVAREQRQQAMHAGCWAGLHLVAVLGLRIPNSVALHVKHSSRNSSSSFSRSTSRSSSLRSAAGGAANSQAQRRSPRQQRLMRVRRLRDGRRQACSRTGLQRNEAASRRRCLRSPCQQVQMPCLASQGSSCTTSCSGRGCTTRRSRQTAPRMQRLIAGTKVRHTAMQHSAQHQQVVGQWWHRQSRHQAAWQCLMTARAMQTA